VGGVQGHRYLDIRVYTEIEGNADKVPTKKGVTLRPDLIPELMKAPESAQRDPTSPLAAEVT
jgi:Transcriptional Coactivator p15 (PC4)